MKKKTKIGTNVAERRGRRKSVRHYNISCRFFFSSLSFWVGVVVPTRSSCSVQQEEEEKKGSEKSNLRFLKGTLEAIGILLASVKAFWVKIYEREREIR